MFYKLKDAWKWFSVQIAVLAAILALAEDQLPILRYNLPPNWYTWVFIAIMVARMIKQPPKTPK